MKKLFCLMLCLALAVPFFAFAEEQTDVAAMLKLDREAAAAAYEGTWVLTAAYLKDEGLLAVAPEAATLEIRASIEYNVLVNIEAYIHADVTNLQGTLTFTHEEIDVDAYKCSSSWDQFGSGNSIGAAKFRVRDDDEGLFFALLTGADVDDEDMEIMDVIGLNAEGQLILGYSEDHIENDDQAEFEYAYIFSRAAEAE